MAIRRCAGAWCGILFTCSEAGSAPAARSADEGGLLDRVAQWVAGAELRPLLGRRTTRGRLLDLGAGCGRRSLAAVRLGHRVTALEPDPQEAERARRRLAGRATVVESTLEDAEGLGRFESVMAWHVLEHLADPDAALRAIRRHLAPGGRVVLAVPNAASAEAALFDGRWHGWEPSRHRWHLRRAVLGRMMNAAGFVDVRVRAAGGWRYPAGLAYSLAPSLDPQVTSGQGWIGPALAAGLVPIAALTAAAGLGPQLIATGRAPDER